MTYLLAYEIQIFLLEPKLKMCPLLNGRLFEWLFYKIFSPKRLAFAFASIFRCDVHKCIRIRHLIAKEHFRMENGLGSEWALWQSSDCPYSCVYMRSCVCVYDGESVSFCALSLLSQHFFEANIDEVPCHLFVTPHGVAT